MTKSIFYYDDKSKAKFDLKLFSCLTVNENKSLFLLKTSDEKYWISDEVHYGQTIEAIAINDIVFQPTCN